MNILIITSNMGSINDGVGGYANYLADAFCKLPEVQNVYKESGETDSFGKKQMVFSMEMANAIKRAIYKVKNGKVDTVIIEYPFKEYNPIIIPLISSLKKELHKRNGKFILSLHEYFRAKKIRKIVMRKLVKMADYVFVTEKRIQNYFKQSKTNVYIRDIPSIIPVEWQKNENKVFKKRKFIYFGLVIANKAFSEMIEAWKIFNKDGKYELDIMTSSDIILNEDEKYNIRLYKNLNDAEIAIRMKNATYCILPIKPEIGMYNTTFKTATRSGCTIIGIFNEKFKNEKFAVDIKSYSTDDFVKGLKYASNLDEVSLKDNATEAIKFGERYSFEHTARQIVDKLI